MTDIEPSVTENLTLTIQRFEENYDLVTRLMEFDNLVLTFAKTSLLAVHTKIKKHNPNPVLSNEIENTLKQFEQIHQNESLRHQYEKINNQCLVLLVSYFALAVESMFKDSLVPALQVLPAESVKTEPIKLSIEDLRKTNFDLRTSIGDIVAKDISFQDMQSINRAFQTYYTFKITQDKTVNNIIAAQACRHVIVHSGGIVNQRLLNQLSAANPRDIKTQLINDTELGFSRDEVRSIGASMKSYMEDVALKVKEVLGEV